MKCITCERCGQEQGFNLHTTKMKAGVERVYIVCEKCKEQYTAYYTDKAIRALQARQRKIAAMISKKRGEEYQKLHDEYEDNKEVLAIMMFELRQQAEQSG